METPEPLKHNTKSLELIPFLEITDKAREIAVAWVENYTPYGSTLPEIAQKHKLASDIMNYAKEENAALTQQVEELTGKLEFYRTETAKIREFVFSRKDIGHPTQGIFSAIVDKFKQFESELEELKKEREIYQEALEGTKILEGINFWQRLEMFISNVQVNDLPSEEEKEMILNVTKAALNSPLKDKNIEVGDRPFGVHP